jgi:hypothetical protein
MGLSEYIKTNIEKVSAEQFVKTIDLKNKDPKNTPAITFFIVDDHDIEKLKDEVDIFLPQETPQVKKFWLGCIIGVPEKDGIFLSHIDSSMKDCVRIEKRRDEKQGIAVSILIQTKRDVTDGIGVRAENCDGYSFLGINSKDACWFGRPSWI